METKVIKISRENYDWLLSVASVIQKTENRSATFDDAISKIRKQRVSDLAGTWKISKKEADELIKDIYESRVWSKRSA